MSNTIPYTNAIESLDSTIAMAIDQLEGDRDLAIELDVITDTEAEYIQDYLDDLEAIRGKINHA